MKKIITLALAAVLTLGLVTLPKAEDKNTDFTKTVAEQKLDRLNDKTEGLKKAVEEAQKKVDEAQKASDEKAEELTAAVNEKKSKEDVEKAAQAAVTAKATLETEKKALKKAQEDLNANMVSIVKLNNEIAQYRKDHGLDKPYGHIIFRLNGENVKLVEAYAGKHDVKSLLVQYGLDDLYAYEGKDTEIILGKDDYLTINVVKRHNLKVIAETVDGLQLGTYSILLKKSEPYGFVTAKDVAPKALTFDKDKQLVAGVDGYFVLLDNEFNSKPQSFNTFTQGGNTSIRAQYGVAKYATPEDAAKAAELGKTTKAGKDTKAGQVAKTGEVATVATGLGALMTLAGVVLATKRH